MTAADLAATPSESVGFVLQMAAVGGLLGTGYALHRRRRDLDADTWVPTAVAGLAAAFVAAGSVLLEALL